MNKSFLLALGAAALLLTACEEPAPPAEPAVRAIKHMTVDQRAGSQTRLIAGVTEAAAVSNLSFESSGRMTEILVDIGDQVRSGDVLARLDSEPFKLRVQTAQSQQAEAKARLRDAQTKFGQQQQLYRQGYAAKAAYDTALATKETAESALEVAETQVRQAERDLEKSVLRSPANGTVSEKLIERFAEVSAGQQVLEIAVDGLTKVKVNVPEGLVQRLTSGQSVTATFPTLQDKQLAGRITQIGARASTTNSFPVTVQMDENDTVLQPGLTAEVTFSYKTGASDKAFLLPLGAVLPSGEQDIGHVFVFNQSTGTVSRKQVTIVNVSGNLLEVADGVTAGDIIAIAGVSFLTDGQKVKLLTAEEGTGK